MHTGRNGEAVSPRVHGTIVNMNTTHTLRSARGFTLVEILVAVGIIGVMSSVVIGAMANSRQQARDKVRVSDIEQIQLALRLYVENTGSFSAISGGAYADGVEVGVGGAIDTALAFYGRLPVDSRSGDGTYAYIYDSSYDCGGSTERVVYVNTFERQTNLANEQQVCGTTTGTGRYIIVLR